MQSEKNPLEGDSPPFEGEPPSWKTWGEVPLMSGFPVLSTDVIIDID